MVRFSNGFYSFSDSYLKRKNKKDLINYIRTIEKNWENALITNDIQYSNCKRLLAEERNKAIDDFLKKICEKYTEEESKGQYKQYCCAIKNELAEIAEQLKGGAI